MSKDKYILVVGGAGYIGSHTTKELNRRGFKTIVIDNLIYGHREFVKWGELLIGDLLDKDFLKTVFNCYDIECVMHFAAFAYVGESVSDPEKYYVNNVAATLNLLAVMKEFGVNKLVFSSSCAIYGIPTKIPISESEPMHPINPYGRSKAMVEHILEDYSNAYGLKYVSLRYFNAAGADSELEIGESHNPEWHILPLIFDAATGKKDNVTIFGADYDTPDGTCIRDYIHVSDIARAHAKAYEYLSEGNASICLNIGNGVGASVADLISGVQKVTGKHIPVNFKGKRIGDPAILIGNAKKALDVLGWSPEYTSIDAIITTAWDWYLKQK